LMNRAKQFFSKPIVKVVWNAFGGINSFLDGLKSLIPILEIAKRI
jgi:hypothetical protein